VPGLLVSMRGLLFQIDQVIPGCPQSVERAWIASGGYMIEQAYQAVAAVNQSGLFEAFNTGFDRGRQLALRPLFEGLDQCVDLASGPVQVIHLGDAFAIAS
jgi:hypothetical protein